MFDHVRFAGRYSEQFILVCKHARATKWAAARLEKLDPSSAVRVVLAALTDDSGNPRWPLLRALGISEHPYNLDRNDLRAMIVRKFGELQAGFIVYREFLDDRVIRVHAPQPSSSDGSTVDSSTPATFIAVETVDEEGVAITGLRFEVALPDGDTRTAITSRNGVIDLAVPTPGSCQVRVPNREARA